MILCAFPVTSLQYLDVIMDGHLSAVSARSLCEFSIRAVLQASGAERLTIEPGLSKTLSI